MIFGMMGLTMTNHLRCDHLVGSHKIIPSSDLAIGDIPCQAKTPDSCDRSAINRVICQLNHHLSRLMSARAAARKGLSEKSTALKITWSSRLFGTAQIWLGSHKWYLRYRFTRAISSIFRLTHLRPQDKARWPRAVFCFVPLAGRNSKIS